MPIVHVRRRSFWRAARPSRWIMIKNNSSRSRRQTFGIATPVLHESQSAIIRPHGEHICASALLSVVPLGRFVRGRFFKKMQRKILFGRSARDSVILCVVTSLGCRRINFLESNRHLAKPSELRMTSKATTIEEDRNWVFIGFRMILNNKRLNITLRTPYSTIHWNAYSRMICNYLNNIVKNFRK